MIPQHGTMPPSKRPIAIRLSLCHWFSGSPFSLIVGTIKTGVRTMTAAVLNLRRNDIYQKTKQWAF
jgi:hypothetical protein